MGDHESIVDAIFHGEAEALRFNRITWEGDPALIVRMAPTRRDPALDPVEERVRDVLAEGPTTKVELAKRTGDSIQEVKAALHRIDRDGDLERVGQEPPGPQGGRPRTLYQVRA